MALSFQEAYRQAKAAAAGKPVKVGKPKAVKAAVVERIEVQTPAKQAKQIIKARKEQRNAAPPREKVFKTIPFNPAGMIKVVVDSKTTVYAKPGADIEAIKAKYKQKPIFKPKDDDGPGYQF